jgi:Putative cell wall-binding domain
LKSKTKVLLSLVCIVSLIFSLSLLAQASPGKASPGKSASHRFYGQDRFQTSTSIATELNDGQQIQNIVLASAYNFPDALSASTLAYQLKAPIILVSPGHKDSMASYNFVKDHLVPGGRVTIVGGIGIISHESEQWLLDKGFHVNRLGGKDLFATNALIVNQLNVPRGTPVIIASGMNFPDALGISSLSASKGWPILLSNPSNLTQSAQDFLSNDRPTDVYVVGGEGIIHRGVYNQILNLSPNSQIQRLGGYDRFETLALILNKFYPNPSQIYVANGFDFADALSGSTLAAVHNAPILLVNPQDNNLSKSIFEYLVMLTNNDVHPQVNVLGGEGAVPQRLVDKITGVLENGRDVTNISETLTVKSSSKTRLLIGVSPAIDNMTANNFKLLNSLGEPVAITDATALSGGASYVLNASLNSGQIYTLTAVKSGYTFGADQYVIIPTTTHSRTLTVSKSSTTGFSVTVDPALNGLSASDFILLDGSTGVTINSVSTTNSGKTYQIAATLTAGHTYTLTAFKNDYYFGTVQSVIVPSPATVSSAVISDGRHIILTMSNALNGSISDPQAFRVTGAASEPRVTSVWISGTRVTLTLSSSIVSTDSDATVNYTKTGSNDLTNGAPVANFNITVVNQ